MTITHTVKEDASSYSRTSVNKIKIENPHDKFFKETLGSIEVVKSFLLHYLPSEIIKIIDEDTLSPEKDSFIDKELKERFSDLLFSANIYGREGYIYFLFEHKSYTDRSVIFQLLKYMTEIWNMKLLKEKTELLPVIIPLVIYHGASEWNIETTLADMISGYKEFPNGVKKYIPNYEYLIYDLSNYTDEQIKGDARIKIMITLYRDVQKAENVEELLDTIAKAIHYLRELEDRQTGMEYFKTVIRYIFSAAKNLTRNDMNKIVKKIENTYPEGSELVMTLADILREEGKQEGKKEGIKAVALEMLKKGSSIHFVAEVTHLDVKEIEKLKRLV